MSVELIEFLRMNIGNFDADQRRFVEPLLNGYENTIAQLTAANARIAELGDLLHAATVDADGLRFRIAELEAQVEAPEPDWSTAPEWANWWAVDEDGEKYWYETEPIKGNATWWSADRCRFISEDNSNTWRNTLRHRPQVQA